VTWCLLAHSRGGGDDEGPAHLQRALIGAGPPCTLKRNLAHKKLLPSKWGIFGGFLPLDFEKEDQHKFLVRLKA